SPTGPVTWSSGTTCVPCTAVATTTSATTAATCGARPSAKLPRQRSPTIRLRRCSSPRARWPSTRTDRGADLRLALLACRRCGGRGQQARGQDIADPAGQLLDGHEGPRHGQTCAQREDIDGCQHPAMQGPPCCGE